MLVLLVVGSTVSQKISRGDGLTREVAVSFQELNVASTLRDFCTVADPGWYNAIAHEGYEKIPFSSRDQRRWAFFPFFPLTWRLAASITREYELTGIVLSHLYFFLALVLLHKTVQAFGYSQSIAERAIFYVAIYPTSFFFSFPMTESLFLLLTVASVLCARKSRWWLAALLAALASATRPTGALLAPTLALMYWHHYGDNWRRKELFSLFIAPLGLVGFMIYLHQITGNALAFVDVQSAWGRQAGFFGWPLLDYVRHPAIAAPWDLRILNFAAAAGALVCGVLLLKWRQWALGTYTLIAVIMTLSSLLLIAQARYTMILFPVHLVLAMAGQRTYMDVTIRTVFSGLLFLMTALYAANFYWLR